jgi:hypothetical protein
MKTLLLIGMATVCFAASEPVVSLGSLRAVEASVNDRMRSNINDPYDLLGTARGTYLEGYGAVFSVELNLVMVSPLNLSPFKQSITEKEIAVMHERKAQKVAALKESLRGLMLSASKQLPGLPANERIVMEAFLFNWNWENARGLPHRIMLTAEKQKLLDALNRHASGRELNALFTEEEL